MTPLPEREQQLLDRCNRYAADLLQARQECVSICRDRDFYESSYRKKCEDLQRALSQLAALQARIAQLPLEGLDRVLREYYAACYLHFGALPEHAGRTGPELMAVLDVARRMADLAAALKED